ncbi:hypothetical protein [Haloferula sp. A504]|uniref:hypothetical protein n=1 Tax=Haloferula sp. A504 TaxID=3373601 RepID=UPI0031CB33CF|nr:hypothetical protein [Verrucomicrobiaceae bacterium E54]
MAHSDYIELMAGNADTSDAAELRKKLAGMVEVDRAEVVETMMVVCRSGERATAESIREFIYPTEYEPPGYEPPPLPPEWIRRMNNLARLRLPTAHTAFETRNAGSTFDIAPNLGINGRIIDLQLAPEIVMLTGYEVYAEFEALGGHVHQDKWPVFTTQRTNNSLTCIDGQYVLASVLTSSDEEGEIDPSRKILVLVKCDVLVVK